LVQAPSNLGSLRKNFAKNSAIECVLSFNIYFSIGIEWKR
jgi:hypothetical protein